MLIYYVLMSVQFLQNSTVKPSIFTFSNLNMSLKEVNEGSIG